MAYWVAGRAVAEARDARGPVAPLPAPPAAGPARGSSGQAKRLPPSREAVLALPPFEGLGLAQIVQPASADDFARARGDLLGARFVGFDTEVRPSFQAGEALRGPDVVQFAHGRRGYVLQLHQPESEALVREVLVAPGVVKVGFDLRSDQRQLMLRLGVHAQPLLDLDFVFRAQGYPKTIGVKAAVALVFGRRFMKSRHVTTSNWSRARLEPRQILYAANDAYAAWAVLDALDLPASELPIWSNGMNAA